MVRVLSNGVTYEVRALDTGRTSTVHAQRLCLFRPYAPPGSPDPDEEAGPNDIVAERTTDSVAQASSVNGAAAESAGS